MTVLNLPSAAVTAPVSAADLLHAGLLEAGLGCVISPHAIFPVADALGTVRPIVLGERCTVGAGAVLHGGVRLGAGVRVEDHTIVGQPEYGYAVRQVYPGAGAVTEIGAGVRCSPGSHITAATL